MRDDIILKTLIVSPFKTNCYILGCSRTGACAVIDPGDEAERISKAVADEELSCQKIVLTHCHIDHVGAAGQLSEVTAAAVCLHRNDMPLLRGIAVQAGLFGMPRPAKIRNRQYIEENELLKIGEIYLTIIHTPGHSPGSISLHGNGFVFVGDTLFQESIGRTDLIGGSYATLIDSLRNKLMLLPDATVVYPGHGPTTTIGYERGCNPFFTV